MSYEVYANFDFFCSRHGKVSLRKGPYCPKCGQRMITQDIVEEEEE